MRKSRIAPALWLALVVVTAARAASQSMLADQSEVAYVASQLGAQVEGSFARFDAQIDLDPGRLQTSSVSLSVDTTSLDFPSTDVLKELAKPDWFDTARFPTAEFRSNRIRALASDRYEVSGTLTIKGHAREVVVPVNLSRTGTTTFASGALTIKRLDYGVGAGEWSDTSLVADEVQIKFKIAVSGLSSS